MLTDKLHAGAVCQEPKGKLHYGALYVNYTLMFVVNRLVNSILMVSGN